MSSRVLPGIFARPSDRVEWRLVFVVDDFFAGLVFLTVFFLDAGFFFAVFFLAGFFVGFFEPGFFAIFLLRIVFFLAMALCSVCKNSFSVQSCGRATDRTIVAVECLSLEHGCQTTRPLRYSRGGLIQPTIEATR